MRISCTPSQTETPSEALLALQRETRQEHGNVSFEILRAAGQPVSSLLLEAFEDEEALATIAWMASCRVIQR
jgi:quinol monooxygenase YgiN